MKANYSASSGSANRPPAAFDTFSLLATSNPSSRSLSPSNPPRPAAGQSTTGPPVNSNKLDVFSSLLGPSFPSSNNSGNLSLAERRAAALKEQQAKAADDRLAKENEPTVWSGLDMIGQSSSTAINGSLKSTPLVSGDAFSDDSWLFDKLAPSAAPSKVASPPSVVQDDDWGLSDFATRTQPSTYPPEQTDSLSFFDALGDSAHDGDLLSDYSGEHIIQPKVARNNDDADDDILGILGKPVEAILKRPTPPQPASSAAREDHFLSRSETSSPPPHVIGQIVEMGFSPQQARLALAATDTGLDVQQALEMLLSNGVGSEEQQDSLPPTSHSRGLSEFQDEEEPWEDRRTAASREHRPTQQDAPSSLTPSSGAQNQISSLVPTDIQERADKLLAQASEIGLNMFSRANALLKDGREKMQKAYEERAAKGKSTDGRPRWMSEIPADHDSQAQKTASGGDAVVESGFRDDDTTEIAPRERPRRSKAGPNGSVQELPVPQVTAVKTANLFDEPAVYVSPARRRPAASRTVSHSPMPGTSSAQQPPPPHTTPALKVRQTVSASTSAIATSNAHKVKGTEMFKLGQYAEAEKAYSAALAPLPANHLLVIPLYNNRALARIKTGDHTSAVEDCTSVLSIIGSGYHPSREAKVTREEEGSSVDLADALVKAYRRRAEAYEGREKWELAQKDWEAVIGCDWSTKTRSDAVSKASRCRKMVTAERSPPPRRVQPAPQPVTRSTNSTRTFEAVEKLRRANQAQEEEEQTKAALNDAVDAKLNAWKGGKEANIRALVASLDTVLWPGLGWQKVGLHELVTPSQVKIRYMKAIAKLHPDKLNSINTTVEQRMIANGVFGTLNDAWIVFNK
ncbi:hypothetical protein EW145_g604 [Phellinidium pouzarii]|uniref:UBA domain-containing protein n=1 Tax=Phellinidium pouzarii TaxID=167371 RepID=A0A4S4LID2_9AGAM|nr:hypothetical protein EW145_g604 [Phellinidium pouzarii]